MRVLRLLICPVNHAIQSPHPFPVASYQAVETVLGLESNYLSFERLQTPPEAFEVPLKKGAIGFVVKPGKWDDDATDFCLCGVFDPTTMRTSCILRILTKGDLAAFCARLREIWNFAWYPPLLPTLLLELRLRDLPETMTRIRKFLYRVEKTTGTHKNYLRRLGLTRSKGRTMQEVWNDKDFNVAPAELTSIASDCAYYEYACIMRLDLLAWLEGLHARMWSASRSPANGPTSRMLETKFEFMKRWLVEVRNRSAYLGKRAGVQVQTCQSLMAQRDNALNKQTSDASLNISKSSLETSRYSRMDSDDMRTIAAVTLAFLPGTFMATLFSTGFFDFKSGPVVSSSFWLYWVFTLCLTTIVFVGWILFRRRRRATPKHELSIYLAAEENPLY